MAAFKIVISALDRTDSVLGKVRKNLGAVGRSVDKLKKRFPNLAAVAGGALNKVAGALKTVAKTAGIAAAAGAGIFAFMVKSSMSATDNLAKTARKIGTTTEALSKMRYAADLTGVSATTMDMALQRFTRRTAEAAVGTGEAKGALKELNINAREMLKLPMEEQMAELASAFEKVKNPADRVRLAMKLFDSEGVALVNTLGLGKEALEEMMGEAAALGIVMSQDAAEGVEDANDAFSRLGYLFKGVRDQLTGALAPALEAFADFLRNKLQTAIQESGGSVEQFAQDLAIKIMDGVAGALQALQNLINGVIRTFNEVKIAAAEFTGFFKKDEEKNIIQLRAKLRSLNEEQAKNNKLAESGGMNPQAAERANALIEEQKTKLLDLALARQESGEIPLVPEVNYMDAINETFEGIKEGIIGVREEKQISAEADAENNAGNQKEAEKQTAFELYNADLKAEGERKLTDFKSKNLGDQTKDVLGNLSAQMGAFKGQSKKLFALSKAAAIGKAIINTYEGATKAISAYPPPINYAMAAATVAGGMAQVAQIRAQSFDGGGYTGNSTRSGGVDGKGGFYAILHPQETVIDHTKPSNELQQTIKGKADMAAMKSKLPSFDGGGYTGGAVVNNNIVPVAMMTPQQSDTGRGEESGGQEVVVNQTLNISTGVANTVRAEIANLMPQIAEATSNAVAQQRMRGGNYSRQLLGR
jgi:hypothetical protein